jgi:hypothetical protein
MPVVYAAPMLAFAEFDRLWQDPRSIFNYLKAPTAADVWPKNTRTPLISHILTGTKYRPELSAAIRVNRYSSWPSVSSTAQDMRENYLGEVQQVRYAQAFDFNFQVDFWCQDPNTQNIFYEQLFNAFRVSTAGEQQTWVNVPYPPTHGNQLVRLRVTSDPVNIIDTNAPPVDNTTLYHTSVGLTIEGYRPDRTIITVPTVWYMGIATDPDNLSPADLNSLFLVGNFDLRAQPLNPIVDLRSRTMPPAGGTYSGSYNGTTF